ncbi:hypothetical protein [Roseomonas sp. 18066]|uniref:hypothetical protein n=1 Tax=Roseomonas sp. 18066 TaxID=2681412 RepID=UPI00135B2D60|nr:hypothetical protein [Roseomonas sp. 18066]
MSNRIVVHEEVETGRRLSMTDVRFTPLDYETLRTNRPRGDVLLPISLGGCVVSSDHPGIAAGQYLRAAFELNSPFTSDAVSLVPGGWLPSTLAGKGGDATLLIDRNVATEILSRFVDGSSKGRAPDFLDFLEDQNVIINPALCAIEGDSRAEPTLDDIRRLVETTAAKLAKALPKARIAAGEDMIEGVSRIAANTAGSLGDRSRFLIELAPHLENPVSAARKEAAWLMVLEAADRHGVARRSLVVLAALSVVTAKQEHAHARGVLKFKPNGYTAGDAYNALADLRALEIYLTAVALFPEAPPAFCTIDRELALFWAALRAENFRAAGGTATYDLNPIDGLFASDYRSRWLNDTGAH